MLPGLPGAGAPPPMGAGPAAMDPSMAMLLGGPGAGAPPPAMSPQQAQDPNAAILQQFMQIDQMVDAISRQFPQSADAAQQVKDGLKQMLVGIISSQPGPDSAPAPPAL